MSSGATTMAAAVVGALIGSAPGWAALLVSNRRALGQQTEHLERLTAKQTHELKTHISGAATPPTQDGGTP